jgi:hypothetical protein
VKRRKARHYADLAPGSTKGTARIPEQYFSAHLPEKNVNQMRTEASHEDASVKVESVIG